MNSVDWEARIRLSKSSAVAARWRGGRRGGEGTELPRTDDTQMMSVCEQGITWKTRDRWSQELRRMRDGMGGEE